MNTDIINTLRFNDVNKKVDMWISINNINPRIKKSILEHIYANNTIANMKINPEQLLYNDESINEFLSSINISEQLKNIS
jgi:hypothetical protein